MNLSDTSVEGHPAGNEVPGEDFAASVTRVAALSDPTRRALYLYVVDQVESVTREQAATACDVPVHTAKFHLDRLVVEGLLEVSARRVSGRTGPGAGRPAKVYRPSEREVSVSLPERSYELAARLLARGVETALRSGTPIGAAVDEAARRHGQQIARAAPAPGATGLTDDEQLRRVATVLAAEGYRPAPTGPGEELRLRSCPFERLTAEHLALVCGMNLALVDGVIDGLSCTTLSAGLQPAPDLCCVRVRGSDPAR